METCKVWLLNSKNEVQYGLNWGQRENRDPNQSYLQLEPEVYNGDFFPVKGKYFIVETDDNETIIFNRAQKEKGCALQTPENNAILGGYIRKRLGIINGAEIVKDDIVKYGRDFITFTKIDDLHYKLDFSNGSETKTIFKPTKPLQQIYYGAPGTGKSFTIDNLTNDDNSVRTTFHPDTDYASFVGSYKPTMKDMPLSAFVGKEVHRAQPQGEHPGTEQRIVYKYVPQAFLKAYVSAWSKLDTPYYLIIEEINRGNCAQIFGDLFQLLDRNNSGSSSYAINADEDISKFLKEDTKGFASLSQEQRDAIAAYEFVKDNGERRAIGGKILDGTILLLPPNLHIWATMNTSDQSLFPIDSAFKRRWNWKYVPIDTNPINKNTNLPLNWMFEVAGNLYSWGKFLEKINPEIYSITESSDKQMGYFFAKADPTTGIISEEVFLNKVLFYLWTDVFKDYDVSSDIFKNKKENRSFRFTDFFEDADALSNFIENCGLDSEEIEPQNAEDEEKQSRRKPYTSLSVSFPDGTIVKEDTIYDTFRTAIEKIGLDRIADFAKSAPIMRKGLPIIDTQEQQVLLDANYTYEQVGNYFVLSQIKNISYRKFLEEASKTLNLNINITLE